MAAVDDDAAVEERMYAYSRGETPAAGELEIQWAAVEVEQSVDPSERREDSGGPRAETLMARRNAKVFKYYRRDFCGRSEASDRRRDLAF
jgi:hypothetical protein